MFYTKNILRLIIKIRKTRLFLHHERQITSNMPKFKELISKSRNVVILTGSGISRESGIPPFRGSTWRDMEPETLASSAVFRDDPGLVWEFYHFCRDVVLQKKPNAAHKAIAKFEEKYKETKAVTVITQTIDGLHLSAGSKTVLEINGNLFKTRCTKCNQVLMNRDHPICPALAGSGNPTSSKLVSNIPVKDLPHCKKPNCGGLLRPHVIWFGETVDPVLVDKLDAAISVCDMCLIVGTSSLVYPAAAYPTVIAAGGATVAEFNIDPGPHNPKYDFYFKGRSATTIPIALE